MRAAVPAGAVVFIALFGLTTFLPAPRARAEAQRYFSATTIERGLQHSLEGKLLFWSSTFVHLGALALVVCTGFARRLTDVFECWTGRRWLLTLLLVGAFLFLGEEVLSLPFGLWGLEWQRAWGLTHRSVADWLTDHGKAVALDAVTGTVVVVGGYALLRWVPRWWWALAAACGTALAICYAVILPIWINPLFNTFTPLTQTPWKNLERPVEALAARAGVPVQEILVMDASRQGSHTNAYYTGFGATQRIVLFDTLLKSHPPAEVESILAHELGHWTHRHILKGLTLLGVALFVGLFLLAQVLRWAVGRPAFFLTSPSDPTGLPLILLLLVLASWTARPVESAISRYFERQADQTSLELADHPQVFIAAERRLAEDNISNVAPNPLSVWLFASHPPPVERIQMAEAWQSKHR